LTGISFFLFVTTKGKYQENKKMNKLFLAIIILILGNILAWYQLNAQFKWTESAFWNNPYLMSIFGIPVGYAFFIATKLCFEHFGFTWNMRMIGFGVGTLVFGIMSWLMLDEIPTLKTFICIILAIAIILIQVTNLVE
tara:strand:- start:7 stop:420 length:414 start_codon:yes stop_codon:yes gene_type:complete